MSNLKKPVLGPIFDKYEIYTPLKCEGENQQSLVFNDIVAMTELNKYKNK